MAKQPSDEEKLKSEAEAKSAEEKRIAGEKAAAELSEAEAKAEINSLKAHELSAPKSNLDMLREQQKINERINYQAAQVKGQTFVRGK